MSEVTALRAFANAVFDDWPDGDIDACDLQELGIKYGLLEGREVTGPCHEDACACAEIGDFPMTCYRRSKLLTGEL